MSDPHHWLDRHIIEQANHYGTSPEKLAKLMSDAADYDELIVRHEVPEPSSGQYI